MSDAIVPDSGYIDNLHIYNTTEEELEIQEQNSATEPASRNTPNSLTKPKVGQSYMNQRNKESIRELSNANFNTKYMIQLQNEIREPIIEEEMTVSGTSLGGNAIEQTEIMSSENEAKYSCSYSQSNYQSCEPDHTYLSPHRVCPANPENLSPSPTPMRTTKNYMKTNSMKTLTRDA